MSETLSFTDGTELVFKTLPWANWNLSIHRKDDPSRDIVHAVEPDNGHSIAVHERDCLYRRREVGSRQGERQAEYQRLKLHKIAVDKRENTWLIFEDNNRYSAKGVLAMLHSSNRTWRRHSPRGSDGCHSIWRHWEDIREHAVVPIPPSCAALSVEQVSGPGSRNQINEFLEGGSDGLVDHSLGGVHGWKTAFKAVYNDETIAVLILSTPASPRIDPDRELVISRLACHPVRPKNTSSWLIARVRDWVRKNGYERLVAYAGAGGNDGTCYKAAGFNRVESVWADGSGWTNREGRQEVAGGQRWRRSKWVYELR